MAQFNSLRFTLCVALLGALVSGRQTQARSTLAPRFAEQVIAGPGIEHSTPLYLHCFPGDGEAILRVQLRCDSALVELKSAHSTLGQARTTADLIEIDYRAKPLGHEQVDTLQLTLVARTGAVQLSWQSTVRTSADSSGERGADALLQVAPPLRLGVELRPAQVFAGEQIRLEAVVRNDDTRGLNSVVWEWPEGLEVDPAPSRHHWPVPLATGRPDTLVWQARIAPWAAGQLVVHGRAGASQVAGSPLPETTLLVVAAPLVQVMPDSGQWLETGRPGRLICQWQNQGREALDIAALKIEIPASFTQVRVLQTSLGKAVVQPSAVVVEEVGSLAPGQVASLELEITPQRPGPFYWPSAFRPAQRPDFVPVAGQTTLRVAEAKTDQQPAGDLPATDLELLRQAFAQAANSALGQLPLPPGAKIYLEPFEKTDMNWVLDDALVAVLMRQGYQVLLKPEAEAVVLRYRLADSRVIYTPAPQGWNPFGGRQRREAYGELYLRLESSDHHIDWMRRVQAYQTDVVPAGQTGAQTASALFKSTRIEDRHQAIERGLSASILGGLFYIFFIP